MFGTMTAIGIEPADPTGKIAVFDATQTARLLDFASLVDAVEHAATHYAQGVILSPERLVVPMGTGGVLLSMPAVAPDLAIHKLVTVQPANAARQLPTIHGTVTLCDPDTGRPLALLDGPEVTGRRTAAVSFLAIRRLLGRSLDEVLIIGTGAQAFFHLQALAALHPRCRVWVRGTDRSRAQRFCERAQGVHGAPVMPAGEDVPTGVQVVITLTTSRQPVYDEPAVAGRLVIGVGAFKPDMAEIGRVTLAGSDLYVDDAAGARHEAGDLLRAGVDWAAVKSLAQLVKGEADPARPAVFKSVGTAAWDLAAGRVALAALGGPRRSAY